MASPHIALPHGGVYRALSDMTWECNTQLSGVLPCREPFQSCLVVYQATLSPQVCGVPFVMERQGGAAHLQMRGAPGQQIGTWQQRRVASPNTA